MQLASYTISRSTVAGSSALPDVFSTVWVMTKEPSSPIRFSASPGIVSPGISWYTPVSTRRDVTAGAALPPRPQSLPGRRPLSILCSPLRSRSHCSGWTARPCCTRNDRRPAQVVLRAAYPLAVFVDQLGLRVSVPVCYCVLIGLVGTAIPFRKLPEHLAVIACVRPLQVFPDT